MAPAFTVVSFIVLFLVQYGTGLYEGTFDFQHRIFHFLQYSAPFSLSAFMSPLCHLHVTFMSPLCHLYVTFMSPLTHDRLFKDTLDTQLLYIVYHHTVYSSALVIFVLYHRSKYSCWSTCQSIPWSIWKTRCYIRCRW